VYKIGECAWPNIAWNYKRKWRITGSPSRFSKANLKSSLTSVVLKQKKRLSSDLIPDRAKVDNRLGAGTSKPWDFCYAYLAEKVRTRRSDVMNIRCRRRCHIR